MPKGRIYGEVKGIGDIEYINVLIRKDVAKAKNRSMLTELHKRSMYIRTLCDSPAWRKAFWGKITEMKKVAEKEFTKTAKAINTRAWRLGLTPDYDEKWGPGR